MSHAEEISEKTLSRHGISTKSMWLKHSEKQMDFLEDDSKAVVE